MLGEAPFARAGQLLAAGSDLDGDGREDLALAAPGRWLAVITDPPASELLAVEGAHTLFVSNVEAGGTQLVGWSDLALPGDIDGDGAPDLTIAAEVDDAQIGPVRVVLGAPGPLPAGTVDVATLPQWRLAVAFTGFALAEGDFDGDGLGEAATWVADTEGVYFLGQ